jgi:hypothetical protein
MLLLDIKENKLNTLPDDDVGNSIGYCCLILLKFQLFLLIILLQNFKSELTFQRLRAQGRNVMSNKPSKRFLKILNSYFKIFTGMFSNFLSFKHIVAFNIYVRLKCIIVHPKAVVLVNIFIVKI